MFKVSILVRSNQAAGFADFASSVANRLLLHGYVSKSKREGVYIVEAEGRSNQINDLIEACNENDYGWSVIQYNLQSIERIAYPAFTVHNYEKAS